MKHIYLVLTMLLIISSLWSISLKETYDTAEEQGEYEKYIQLETGVTYTGGLYIGKVLGYISNELDGPDGIDVHIQGNGAVIDLQGQEICMSYVNNILEITDCIILNGNIRFRGINSTLYNVQPTGYVTDITFYKPQDYGIRITGCGEGITLQNNIIVDAVNTGPDFNYITGETAPFLITGPSIAISLFDDIYGTPVILDNWSYHSDSIINADSLYHFCGL